MNSKERVMTTFANQEPDRVPIDYFANPGIDAKLKDHYGLAVDDDEGLRQALGVDFRGVGAPYTGPRLHAEVPGLNVNPELGIRTRWVEHGSGGYWDYCDFPLAGADPEVIANWPLPSPDDYDYSEVSHYCGLYSDYAVFVGGAGLGCIINTTGFLLGMEDTFVALALEDEAVGIFIDRLMEMQLEVASRTLEAGRGAYDFLWMGEDLGTQKSPLISLDMFRKQIRPRHQKFIDLAKSYNIPVMIHTCGSSSWAYEDYIEMGMTAVDTLQPEAADMSPEYLKSHFGGRLAFHGCISTAGPVAYGTVDDVVEDCRRTLEIMMPGGGYCFSPTHSLQDNSPVENVVAMYDTGKLVGQYK